MQRDYLYPDLANRDTPTVWAEKGACGIGEEAKKKAMKLLAEHFPDYLGTEADARIRDGFNILLEQ